MTIKKNPQIKIKKAELYKAIKNYQAARADELFKTNKELFNKIFRDYANATMILSYEISIYKELREEKNKKGEIVLVGVCNSDYDSEKALKENAGDPVKLAIIKEKILDDEAIDEALEMDESYYNATNNRIF